MDHETGRARRTLAAVREGIASGRVPVVPQIIELIRAISDRVDTISVQQLAEIISQDPGTMTRIIGIANKLAYNPGGAEIVTIHQAISVIGFERIRNLAISVMLMENAESELSLEESRKVAGMALASGFLARELVGPAQPIEPEIAFVCAALRNYGKLLLTTFLVEDYARARALSPALGSDPAFREVFGLTPLELGRELLESEQMPSLILDTMRPLPGHGSPNLPLSSKEQIALASDFAVQLMELLEEPSLTLEDFTVRAQQLARTCLPHLQLSPKQIHQHLQQVHLRCQEIARSHATGAGFTPPLFLRLEAVVEERPLPPPSTLPRRLHAQAAAEAARQTTATALRTGTDQLQRLTARSPNDLDALFGILVRLLHDNLRLRQSVVFLLNPDNTTCSARYGSGPVFEAARGKAILSRRARDVFGLCLTRGEDILLQNPDDPKIKAFMPPWLVTVARGDALMVLALRDAVGVFGLILTFSPDREAFLLAEMVRPELHDLRTCFAAIGPVVRSCTRAQAS